MQECPLPLKLLTALLVAPATIPSVETNTQSASAPLNRNALTPDADRGIQCLCVDSAICATMEVANTGILLSRATSPAVQILNNVLCAMTNDFAGMGRCVAAWSIAL